MKKYLFLTATAALALASCSSDNYIGEDPASAAGDVAISFDGGTGVVTRAAKTGNEAASALGNNFVVYGFKTQTVAPTKQTVYDHYSVNYVNGSALSTPSNSAGWEYVNQPFSVLTGLTTDGNAQEIKYWDFAATQYDFIAFSAGGNTIIKTGTPTSNQLLFSQVNNATLTSAAYTIQGSVADLAEAYIADRVTAKSGAAVIANRQYPYKDAIQFNFRSLSSKVRLAIYETIPGYSVKDVKFYVSSTDDDPTTTPALYAASATIPAGTGTMTVKFPEEDAAQTDYNKAHVSYAPAGGSANESKVQFSALTYTTREQLEESTGTAEIFLGRTSATATYAGDATAAGHAYVGILPATAGALTLKVDYTIVAKDGSGETIKVTGATAVVPAEYCNWQPNYAYTYIFKISDKTSGNIHTNPAGLYPITFDAIVTETEEGVQHTITEVTTPSITTYAKGAVNDEYYKNDNIYVKVDGATLETTNTKLFTAVQAQTGTPASPAQGITEESVENCIKNGAIIATTVTDHETVASGATGNQIDAGTDVSSYYTKNAANNYEKCAAGAVAVAGTHYYEIAAANINGYVVKDANDWTLTVSISSLSMTKETEIAAGDAPDGNAISGNFMKFTPGASGNFVFEYSRAAAAAVLWVDGEAGNEDNSKTGQVKTPAVTAGKFYKVIKVTDSNRPQ